MNELEEYRPLRDKILAGLDLSFKRLVEETKKEDGELIFYKDGKIIVVKAKDLAAGRNG